MFQQVTTCMLSTKGDRTSRGGRPRQKGVGFSNRPLHHREENYTNPLLHQRFPDRRRFQQRKLDLSTPAPLVADLGIDAVSTGPSEAGTRMAMDQRPQEEGETSHPNSNKLFLRRP